LAQSDPASFIAEDVPSPKGKTLLIFFSTFLLVLFPKKKVAESLETGVYVFSNADKRPPFPTSLFPVADERLFKDPPLLRLFTGPFFSPSDGNDPCFETGRLWRVENWVSWAHFFFFPY